jgi:hypothetical protein
MNEATATADNVGDDEGAASPQFNAGEQHGVETRRKRVGQARRDRDAALGALLEHRAGRSLIWTLLTRCHVMHTSMVAGDAHMTSFREGERNIGLGLLADVMRVEPKAFAAMQAEATEDAAALNNRPAR